MNLEKYALWHYRKHTVKHWGASLKFQRKRQGGAMRMTISAYADDSIHIVIFLAAYYRLRHSEVLGLKWSAVDFEHNLIKQYICLC